MNFVSANRAEEGEIYPLTVREIAEAQMDDSPLERLAKRRKYSNLLVEDTKVLCRDNKMVIPKTLQHCAVQWYHHYLQHPGHTRLEETL